MNKPTTEPFRKKKSGSWDLRKPIAYICFGVLAFIISAAFGSMAADPKGESKILQIKSDHFCAVTSRSPKIEMIDWTTEKLFYEVTCE